MCMVSVRDAIQRLVIPESLQQPWKELPPELPPPMQHYSDHHRHTSEKSGNGRAWKDGSRSLGSRYDMMPSRSSLSKGPRPPYTVSRRSNSDNHGNGGGSNKGRGR